MPWIHNANLAVDASSQWPTIVAVCISLTIIMTAVVALRGYVRGFLLEAIGKDDWVILFSAICSIIYNGICIGQSRWGLGLNLSVRPKQNIDEYSIINFVGRPFYMAGITGFKVALCISYLRILSKSSRWYRRIVWGVLVTCVLAHLAGTLVLIFQCRPVYKSWKPRTPGVCLPNGITFYSLSAVTILFDCVIFILPIPILMRLKINPRRKAALIGVFMLGTFATICSVLRMVQIETITKTGNSTMLVLWGTIEMNVGIALTCIPTLTPLFTYFRDKSASRYGSSGNKRSNQHGTNMRVLKSSQATRITESSSEGWKDRGDSDNSSQRGNTGLENSVITQSSKAYGRGITVTTGVEVKLSDAGEYGGMEDHEQRFGQRAQLL